MSQYSAAPSPTDGMAMNWVLDHVMTHQEPYQTTLPLRTIYSLNSQTHPSAADFKTLLMEHLSTLPTQPCTLPPVFLTTFVQRCFPPQIEHVDFDQALTALDYIRDLEMRRQKEIAKAIRARGAHEKKVITLRSRAAKLDLLYAKALVGIRRWTLINELRAARFNKFNCVALLNTLYPVNEQDINTHLTAAVLTQQRQALWKYIVGVEKSGAKVLDSVLDVNGGWESIGQSARQFCTTSLDIIQKAEDLARPQSFGSFISDSSAEVDASSTGPPTRSGRQFRSDSSPEHSEWESEPSPKKSTLDKIVKGLARLGVSHHKSKTFYSTEWSSSFEDVKLRH